jgi:hypothetical protein
VRGRSRKRGKMMDSFLVCFEDTPFLSAMESKKAQGASGPEPHLTNAT